MWDPHETMAEPDSMTRPSTKRRCEAATAARLMVPDSTRGRLWTEIAGIAAPGFGVTGPAVRVAVTGPVPDAEAGAVDAKAALGAFDHLIRRPLSVAA